MIAQVDVAQGALGAAAATHASAAERVTEAPVEVPVLKPLDVHPRTSLTVVEQLRHNHYVKKPLDDGISSDVFDKYLENLDGARAYFLATDIQQFESIATHWMTR